MPESTDITAPKTVDNKLLVTDPPAAPLATVPVHPLMATIDDAVKSGRPGADLKELLDLYERMEKKMEEKAYGRDFLAFQQECEPLPRTGKADEVTPRGTRVEFTFCKLSDLDKALPVFWKHGFTREFGTLRLEAGKAILECTFRHRDGHSVTKEAEMLTDSNFLKNAQNRVIGATSYLKRMIFGQMLGVPVCDLEDKPPREPVETISEEQQHTIQDLIIQSEANRVAFLEYFEVKQLGEIQTHRFDEACQMLNEKIARSRKA